MSQLVALPDIDNRHEAQIVQGLLRSAGIPAFFEGQNLQDEWGIAQQLLRPVVRVPEDRLAEALQILEDFRQAARDEAAREE